MSYSFGSVFISAAPMAFSSALHCAGPIVGCRRPLAASLLCCTRPRGSNTVDAAWFVVIGFGDVGIDNLTLRVTQE